MKVTDENYESLRGFFKWMVDHVMPMPPGLDPSGHPVAVLKAFEAKSPAIARKGLAMAISDMAEDATSWPAERIRQIDEQLAQEKLPTLSAVMSEFSSRVRSIIKRARVRSDAEYCALRNAVEAMPEPDKAKAWSILAAYEEKKVSA